MSIMRCFDLLVSMVDPKYICQSDYLKRSSRVESIRLLLTRSEDYPWFSRLKRERYAIAREMERSPLCPYTDSESDDIATGK